ncbi:tyrosine--tRNA ligase [Candidatus Beckwithbacteria bacterium]|nr:tyrosine--tRNA ligase [Candidatus Beckwithbacteria bacterium]
MNQIITEPKIIDDFISRRLDKIVPNKEELKTRLMSGKKLRLYQGFDPSSPNLHIGHLVGLLTLKAFQDLGHEVIFLIGDFTGMIGDPSGKSQARNVTSLEFTQKNAQTYREQAGKILRFEGDNPILIKFNSEWNNKLDFAGVINLATHFTVQQMIERDMFQERFKKNQEVYLNEFLYPLTQGYDSVAMEVDLEVGGTDQLFNMLAGRKLLKELKGIDKLVVTTPLLADSSGNKIGKTEGNAINITNPPEQLYGQMMSLPDSAIMPCFKLITQIPSEQLPEVEEKVKTDPMAAKKHLAWELTKMLNDEAAANKAQEHFEKTVQGGANPDEIAEFTPSTYTPLTILAILGEAELISSNSEGKRLIEQNAVKIDDQVVNDPNQVIELKSGMVIKAGKRKFVRVK